MKTGVVNLHAAAGCLLSFHDRLRQHRIMNQYKGHPIYGVAVPVSGRRWCPRGLIFDRDLTQTIEIKRIDTAEVNFEDKRQAEDHGLKLCRDWIDQQQTGVS